MFRSRWTRGSPNKRQQQQQQQTALQEQQRHAPTPYPDQRKRGGRLQAAASALNLGPGPDLNAFDRSSSVTPGTPSTPATVHAFPPTGSHHQNLPHQQLRLPQSPLSTDATHGHTYPRPSQSVQDLSTPPNGRSRMVHPQAAVGHVQAALSGEPPVIRKKGSLPVLPPVASFSPLITPPRGGTSAGIGGSPYFHAYDALGISSSPPAELVDGAALARLQNGALAAAASTSSFSLPPTMVPPHNPSQTSLQLSINASGHMSIHVPPQGNAQDGPGQGDIDPDEARPRQQQHQLSQTLHQIPTTSSVSIRNAPGFACNKTPSAGAVASRSTPPTFSSKLEHKTKKLFSRLAGPMKRFASWSNNGETLNNSLSPATPENAVDGTGNDIAPTLTSTGLASPPPSKSAKTSKSSRRLRNNTEPLIFRRRSAALNTTPTPHAAATTSTLDLPRLGTANSSTFASHLGAEPRKSPPPTQRKVIGRKGSAHGNTLSTSSISLPLHLVAVPHPNPQWQQRQSRSESTQHLLSAVEGGDGFSEESHSNSHKARSSALWNELKLDAVADGDVNASATSLKVGGGHPQSHRQSHEYAAKNTENHAKHSFAVHSENSYHSQTSTGGHMKSSSTSTPVASSSTATAVQPSSTRMARSTSTMIPPQWKRDSVRMHMDSYYRPGTASMRVDKRRATDLSMHQDPQDEDNHEDQEQPSSNSKGKGKSRSSTNGDVAQTRHTRASTAVIGSSSQVNLVLADDGQSEKHARAIVGPSSDATAGGSTACSGALGPRHRPAPSFSRGRDMRPFTAVGMTQPAAVSPLVQHQHARFSPAPANKVASSESQLEMMRGSSSSTPFGSISPPPALPPRARRDALSPVPRLDSRSSPALGERPISQISELSVSSSAASSTVEQHSNYDRHPLQDGKVERYEERMWRSPSSDHVNGMGRLTVTTNGGSTQNQQGTATEVEDLDQDEGDDGGVTPTRLLFPPYHPPRPLSRSKHNSNGYTYSNASGQLPTTWIELEPSHADPSLIETRTSNRENLYLPSHSNSTSTLALVQD